MVALFVNYEEERNAAVMMESAGKTFSEPQSGIIAWDDPTLTVPITRAFFTTLVATQQVNRVAALENWDNPSRLRFGTIEVTRLRMLKDRVGQIANF